MMNLAELADKLPHRDEIRREIGHLADGLPSAGEVRSRVSELPSRARGWLPHRREPAWTDALSARNLAVFGVGLAVGAGLAALLSPRSGPALRRDLIAARVQRLREPRPRVDGAPPTSNGAGAPADLSH